MFKKGLELLRECKDMVVRPADKGGGMVILDSRAYKSEMSRLLADRDIYVPLAGNPTAKY